MAYCSLLSLYGRSLTALTVGSALLLGCSKNPEGAGKEIASLACDCVTQKDKSMYEYREQVQKDLEAGKYKTKSEVYEAMSKQNKEVARADSACMAKPNALTSQAKVDFVKEEDRTTFSNAAQANYAQCMQEQTAKNEDRKAIDLTVLMSKLPYGEAKTTYHQ